MGSLALTHTLYIILIHWLSSSTHSLAKSRAVPCAKRSSRRSTHYLICRRQPRLMRPAIRTLSASRSILKPSKLRLSQAASTRPLKRTQLLLASRCRPSPATSSSTPARTRPTPARLPWPPTMSSTPNL